VTILGFYGNRKIRDELQERVHDAGRAHGGTLMGKMGIYMCLILETKALAPPSGTQDVLCLLTAIICGILAKTSQYRGLYNFLVRPFNPARSKTSCCRVHRCVPKTKRIRFIPQDAGKCHLVVFSLAQAGLNWI